MRRPKASLGTPGGVSALSAGPFFCTRGVGGVSALSAGPSEYKNASGGVGAKRHHKFGAKKCLKTAKDIIKFIPRTEKYLESSRGLGGK